MLMVVARKRGTTKSLSKILIVLGRLVAASVWAAILAVYLMFLPVLLLAEGIDKLKRRRNMHCWICPRCGKANCDADFCMFCGWTEGPEDAE